MLIVTMEYWQLIFNYLVFEVRQVETTGLLVDKNNSDTIHITVWISRIVTKQNTYDITVTP